MLYNDNDNNNNNNHNIFFFCHGLGKNLIHNS